MNTDLEPYQGGTPEPYAPSVPALPERLSLPEILETAKILAASGYFPTAKEAGQAAAKIMWGQDMGLTPMQAMTGIHVWIQSGTPTMQVSAKVITYLLKRHGFTWEFAQHDAEACEVEVYRHGKRLEPNVRFTKAQAAKAGLANKSVWQGYGEDMLWHRVAGRIADRFAPEIFDAAAIPVMTTEQAESTYPDPRDDLVKALHATYREKHPRPHDADSEEYRNMRLDWASEVLGRQVLSFNGPDHPETLTRADVQTLLDALEFTPALTREQAAPISPGAPSAAGAASTAPSSSAGGGSSSTERQSPPPAEHHTAEVLEEVAPADGTVPAGESRSDTGLPPGPAPTRVISTMQGFLDNSWGWACSVCKAGASGHRSSAVALMAGNDHTCSTPKAAPTTSAWAASAIETGKSATKAPTRTRHKTDPTGAPKVKEAMAQAQQFRDDRKAQTEVEHAPADPIQSMPPKFRELYLKHFGNEMEPALGSVNSHIETWGPKWPAIGDGAPWNLELLRDLAADTFEKDMYR